VRLNGLRHALNRLLERSNGSLRISIGIERKAEEIGQFGGSWLEQETGVESVDGARILLLSSKPLAQFRIGCSIRTVLNAELQRWWTGAWSCHRERSCAKASYQRQRPR